MMALDTASEGDGGPLFRLNNLNTTDTGATFNL
jgi:hypothetical protein